ncbi:CDGSH iron-sulfur domain-containing protein [Streptomyces sp. NPDC058700]|uniref:CDGSH iron-sulfur domain-containing protein n=1 Tax=unclassified Streptomyces TaxID=2593676 RepID=UPI003646F099
MSVSPDGTAGRRSTVPRVEPLAEGPFLMEGPADIVMPDGSVVHCDRPMMALCTCRRSLRAPFCDTSHRPRLKRGSRTRTGRGPRPSGADADESGREDTEPGEPTEEARTP